MGPFLLGLLPALIGGGLSALSRLAMPKPKPIVVTHENTIDFEKFRADAEAAGFNPVAVMRFGGLSGYMRGSSTESAPPDTRLADAIGAFGMALGSWDPLRAKLAGAELKLLGAQTKYYSSAALGSAAGVSSGAFSTDLDLRTFGFKVGQNPGASNAEDWQQRYGEIGDWVGGVSAAVSDVGWNAQPGSLAWIPFFGATLEGLANNARMAGAAALITERSADPLRITVTDNK